MRSFAVITYEKAQKEFANYETTLQENINSAQTKIDKLESLAFKRPMCNVIAYQLSGMRNFCNDLKAKYMQAYNSFSPIISADPRQYLFNLCTKLDNYIEMINDLETEFQDKRPAAFVVDSMSEELDSSEIIGSSLN